ncbi:hypothetical protein KZX50_03570 [Bacillus infantis]|uniref:hypothetical protein n=1 Tax=Bacillus infantis TaxID=324767 RepID=UPI00200456B6|nr:hypothetical protein [Bacillus infantis]MCK6204536.1 hypothetical protein [Bacillus infantis]
MPRGKELEQLPMSNIAPGAGADKGRFNRRSLSGMERKDQPRPEDAGKSQP